jgi:hypothetical protein
MERFSKSSRRTSILAVLLLLCRAGFCYYLPGTYPQEFYFGQRLQGKEKACPLTQPWVLEAALARSLEAEIRASIY